MWSRRSSQSSTVALKVRTAFPVGCVLLLALACDPGWELRRTSKVAAAPDVNCIRMAIESDEKLVFLNALPAGSPVEIVFRSRELGVPGGVICERTGGQNALVVYLGGIAAVPPKDRRPKLDEERNRISRNIATLCSLHVGATTDTCDVAGWKGREFCDDGG
jgi:hypothetical protein